MNSHRTAIARRSLSVPAQHFQPYLAGSVLDFGCGRGSDASLLKVDRYDPHWFPDKPNCQYNIVMLVYVLNVVINPDCLLRVAKSYVRPGGTLMVATRTFKEIEKLAKDNSWKPHGAGWVTGNGTFQRGYAKAELGSLVGWEELMEIKTGGKFSCYIATKPRRF
jgi:SAM-dependent methyltransferase